MFRLKATANRWVEGYVKCRRHASSRKKHKQNYGSIVTHVFILCYNPFRTAVPFWGQITYNLCELSPKRDCGSEGVETATARRQQGAQEEIGYDMMMIALLMARTHPPDLLLMRYIEALRFSRVFFPLRYIPRPLYT